MAKRRTRPAPRWRDRLAAANSPEQELAGAYDWLRSSLSRLMRTRRDTALEATSRAEGHQIMREAARALADLASRIDAREKVTQSGAR